MAYCQREQVRVEDFQSVDFIHEHRVDAHNLARNLVLSSVGRHAWFLSPASGVCKAEWLSPRERERLDLRNYHDSLVRFSHLQKHFITNTDSRYFPFLPFSQKIM
jgi:hypothetical protein